MSITTSSETQNAQSLKIFFEKKFHKSDKKRGCTPIWVFMVLSTLHCALHGSLTNVLTCTVLMLCDAIWQSIPSAKEKGRRLHNSGSRIQWLFGQNRFCPIKK